MNAVNAVVSHMLHHQEEAGHVLALRSAQSLLRLFANQYRFQCGSGSSILGQGGSGSEQGLWWPKIEQNLQLKKVCFDQKLQFTYNLKLGLHKGRPSYIKVFSPQKRTSSTSKHEISSLFLFDGVFFLSCIRIRIPSADSDPDSADQNQCVSGSARLHNSVHLFWLDHMDRSYLSMKFVHKIFR